ncbi:fungal-specific transcription factor domain-containing protein [Lipomyces arxii]|uniref:fungal-specific transcription factor domain-containing protein n=1 Tax=Lipomyces arxii TaxID=56418 RepID=UPI0034CFB2CE
MTDDSSQDDSSSNQNGKRSHVSYRRARASRACEVCHSRKVRCDVTNRMPCTNCVAFGCECKIPDTRRRKNGEKKMKRKHETGSSRASSATRQQANTSALSSKAPSIADDNDQPNTAYQVESGDDGDDEDDDMVSRPLQPDNKVKTLRETSRESGSGTILSTNLTPSSIPQTSTEAAEAWIRMLSANHSAGHQVQRVGKVAYLGSSSNLSLLVQSKAGDSEGCHYPIPDEIRVGSARINELDPEEIEILNRRGAFLLPPRDICDELVESFFEKIHPIVPMINKTQFMRRYNDPKNPPSLLLLQSILLAGTRVCRNPALLDQNGSADLASLTLYKRAKALYEANYEDDRIAIVQSLILLGWWWEGPEDVTKNVFYWTRVALCVAQGFGLHRSVEKSQLAITDKRLWKRLWWVLFSRDRNVAIALGRPVLINTDDTDVPMLVEEDFIEEDGPGPYRYPPIRLHVQHFIQSLKLSEIMGLVLRQQFSVASETSRVANRSPDITHSDMALGAWIKNLPPEMQYNVNDRSKHNFFIALLHLQYYTVLCLLHRTNMSHGKPQVGATNSYLTSYPSRSIAFQSAHMIAKIIENMALAHELRCAPAFTVYTLFSAMIMFVYQTMSQSSQVVDSAQRALKICMDALEEVGTSWMIGKMILKLFQKINDSKQMKDRIFRAVNPREPIYRQKNAASSSSSLSGRSANAQSSYSAPSSNSPVPLGAPEIGYVSPSITPNMSYERTSSRPATPSASAQASVPRQPAMSVHTMQVMHHSEIPMGAPPAPRPTENSMGYFPPAGVQLRATAPSTPASFHASTSIPGTPPDFYFVTHSPPISQTFFDNFQPSQLFPEDQAASFQKQNRQQTPQQGSMPEAWQPDSAGNHVGSAALSQEPAGGVGVSDFVFDGFDQDMPDANNGRGGTSVDASSSLSASSFDNQGASMQMSNGAIPKSLNIGDWYNYLITNNAADGFTDEFAELAHSSGLSTHF